MVSTRNHRDDLLLMDRKSNASFLGIASLFSQHRAPRMARQTSVSDYILVLSPREILLCCFFYVRDHRASC